MRMKATIRIALLLVPMLISSCIWERSTYRNDWGWQKGAEKYHVPAEVSSRHYQ